jgi:cell division septum initiation protein DivIVA
MAVSSSRPDPASPAAVAGASFGISRKGFDPDEVRAFLRAVSAEMTRLEQQVAALQRDLAARQDAGAAAPVQLDEDTVTALLGAETARIVQTAREAAAQIKARAEESSAKLLRDASDEAARVRSEAELEVARRRADANADAEAEVEMARQQGRDMVNEARDYRERVLTDVARRRELARTQLEQLVHGRDRLVNAFERARLAAVDVMAELVPLGAEPDELVNLSPTTGPVPLVARGGADAAASSAVAGDPAADSVDPPLGSEHDPEISDLEVTDLDVTDLDVTDLDVTDLEVSDLGMYDVDDEGEEDWPQDPDLEPTEDDEPEPDEPEPGNGGLEPEPDNIESEDDTVTTVEMVETVETVEIETGSPAAEPDGPVAEVAGGDAGGDLLRMPAHDDDYDDGYDDEDDDRPSAQVVSLFAGEIDGAQRLARLEAVADVDPVSTGEQSAPSDDADTRPTVDDLFAKLRRASAAMVAKEAAEALAADPGSVEGDVSGDESGDESGEPLPGDEIFAERDEALVPLIVSAARKLKRVLADEQNDVLDALRRATSVDRIDTLLPSETEQSARYLAAVTDDLRSAAAVGARSMSTSTDGAHDSVVATALDSVAVLAPVTEAFTSDVVRPLRERLDRAVMQVGEDTDELAVLVRNAYREWKTHRIDEHIEDLVRLAHGRGAFAVIVPGTSVCWRVDPNGPPCADAEDNALAGEVSAGDPFPTGHICPPVHSGCRCLLETPPG